MSSAYKPLPGSLASRVLAFFQKNPEEELSSADIASKYDVSANNVTALLNQCLTHQLLTRRKTSSARAPIFVAGPKLVDFVLPAQPTLSSKSPRALAATDLPPLDDEPHGTRARAESTRGLPPLDLASIEVATDVPVPLARGERTAIYDQIFATKLAQVGNSIEVPAIYEATLKKASQRFAANNEGAQFTFVTRDTKTRIWRKA